MGLTERVWDVANTLKLSDKVDRLNAAKQQPPIEDLNTRVIRI